MSLGIGGGGPEVRRALVTGGAGFVGHGVVAALAHRGVAVSVLDPGPPHPAWPRGVRHHRGDVTDASTVARAARGADAVFHVAGTWDGGPGGEERMRRLNLGGTEVVLALGLPTVVTSSSITCGFGSWERPGTEDEPSEDPRRPIRGTGRVYRETKLGAEAMATDAGAWIVNPDYVVGAGDVHGVVTRPLLLVARLPLIPAPRGGKCFVGLGDVGEGHLLALERGRPGRRYLLGAENRRYGEVFATLARLLGRRPRTAPLPALLPRALKHLPRVGQTMGALEQMTLPRFRSGERARRELGWSPGPVDSALAELVAEAQGPVGPVGPQS